VTVTAPVIYNVNIESHEKNYCDILSAIIESNSERVIARWKRRNIFQGQSLGLNGSKI
jgi:hypothetical protein